MSVKIKGLAKFKSDRRKLLERMAGETSRIVTRTRSFVAKDTLRTLKKNKLVSKNFTRAVLMERYLFAMGPDRVSPQRLLTGFFRTQKIPDTKKGLSFYYLRVRVNKIRTRYSDNKFVGPVKKRKKGKPTTRYRVSVILGREKRDYPGVFLVASKKWIPKPTSDWFGAFRRSGPDRKPVEYVRGPNLVELLRSSGAQVDIQMRAYREWEKHLDDRLSRLINRFHPGHGL